VRSHGLARAFGLLGGIFVLVGSIFTFFFSLALAAIDRSVRLGLSGTATALEQFVFAILILFFAALPGYRSSEYATAGAVILIVLGLLGIVLLDSGILVLIGFVLALIAGILFLVRRM
jgi:hypothetical protein